MWISEEIRDNIVEEDLWIQKGTEVGGFSGANEAIGTIVMKFGSEIEMEKIIENQKQYIKVVVQ